MSCLNDKDPKHPYWYPVEIDENGKPVHHYNSALYPANETLREHGTEEVPPFPGGMWFFDEHEFDDSKCIYGDGGKQAIVTINDQHPGPVLEVVEGALDRGSKFAAALFGDSSSSRRNSNGTYRH